MLQYGQPNPAPLMLLSLLYGVFFALFCWWIFLHTCRHARFQAGSSVERWTLKSVPSIGGLLLLVIISLHVIIQMTTISAALMQRLPMLPGPPVQNAVKVWAVEFSDGAEMSFTVLVTFIGDSLMVYRLWVIRKKRWIVALPLVALLAGLGCGISAAYDWVHPGYTTNVRNCRAIPGGRGWICDEPSLITQSLLLNSVPAGVAFSALTALINMYCSGIIAWTLYQHLHAAQTRHGGPSILDVIRILVESAALYVLVAVVYAIVYAIYFRDDFGLEAIDSSPLSFFTDTIATNFAPMVGITFMLINVRVALGYAITPSQAPSQGQINTAWVAGRMATSRFAESTYRDSMASAD